MELRTSGLAQSLLRAARMLALMVLWLGNANAETPSGCIASALSDQMLRPRLEQIASAPRSELPTIGRTELEDLLPFTLDHPARDGGGAVLHTSKLRGIPVIIKKASAEEAKAAYILSELGVGVRFFGLADFCECYVIERIEDAMVIKSWRLDYKAMQFAKRGWTINEKTREQIRDAIRRLGNLGILPNDAQFLVDSDGRAFLFDPGYFSLPSLNLYPGPRVPNMPSLTRSEDPTSYARKVYRDFERMFEQFKRIQDDARRSTPAAEPVSQPVQPETQI